MSISKRLRYEILKRDGNKCRYCGATADESPLTIDHVVPVSLGGTDDPGNLVAACKDCNAGKSSSNPDAPLVAAVSDDALRWAAAIRTTAEAMAEDAEARGRQKARFKRAWFEFEFGRYNEPAPLPAGWAATVDAFLNGGLPLPVVLDCIDKTMGAQKVRAEDKFRYLCGIAWKKVKELQDTARARVAPAPSAVPDDDSAAYREAVERLFGLLHDFDSDEHVSDLIRQFNEDEVDRQEDGEDLSHWPAAVKAFYRAIEVEVNYRWEFNQFVWTLFHQFDEEDREKALALAREGLAGHELSPDEYRFLLQEKALFIAVHSLIHDAKWMASVTVHDTETAPL
jgi:hypothetical protein